MLVETILLQEPVEDC